MADTTLLGEEFLAHQAKALDYLYDMPLANDSLFLADVSTVGVSTGCFRVKKISFTPPKLKYETDVRRRQSFPVGVDRNDTVTIEWYEDAFNSIQKWTLEILRNRIDFGTGLWKIGGDKIPLDINIYHFAYVEANDKVTSPFDSIAFPKCTDILTLQGLRPEGIGEITYDNDAGGNIKTVTISYRCDHAIIQNLTSAKTEWNEDDFWGFADKLYLL